MIDLSTHDFVSDAHPDHQRRLSVDACFTTELPGASRLHDETARAISRRRSLAATRGRTGAFGGRLHDGGSAGLGRSTRSHPHPGCPNHSYAGSY